MSKWRFEFEVVVDDDELAEWVDDPRSKDNLPIPDVDDWELRDLIAAAGRGIVDEMEALVVNVLPWGDS